jgi:protoporphyrinogen oxidase
MRVDVIGAGISGLSSAYFLAQTQPDAEIHVWERSTTPGGLAGTFTTGGMTIEKFYHHIFTRDVALQQLIAELGLDADLVWRPAMTGAYYFQRPFRLATPLDLLKFKPLPLVDRFRLGWLAIHARLVRDWRSLDDVTARDYIIRVAGRRAFSVVWEPLLRGKFGQYADSVSAAWLWRKLVDRGGSRDSRGQEVLGYLRGGLGRVFETMTARLEAAGHHVHLGKSVLALEGSERIERIVTDEGTFATDAVIAGAQTPDIASLLPPFAAGYARELQRIEFLANVCLVLFLNRPLSDFYWTNVTDPSAPFVGIIEQTKWADRADYGNHHVTYISAYVSPSDPRLKMSASELFDRYLPHVRKLFPDFDRSAVDDVLCWTASYAQPVVSTGYRKLVPDTVGPIDNLFICTMAQIYPADRQVSNGVEMGRTTAAAVKRLAERRK